MNTKQKQCLLAYMDCLAPCDIDGLWGNQSAAATGKLQQKLGLAVDGLWGPETEKAVLSAISGHGASFWDHIRYWTREEFR